MSTTFYPEGLAAIGNARADGFSGVTLSQVGIIQNGTEVKRLTLGAVQVVTSNIIQVSAIDQSVGEYECHALKLYTDTGVPFVLIASGTEEPLQVKTALSDFLMSYELDITPAGSDAVVPSGNPMFLLPIATETLAGAVRIATAAERLALMAGVVPDAPGVADIVRKVGDERFAASAHSHAWSGVTGKPTTFPPSSHSHAWSGVTGKPTTFPPSSHSHAWSGITEKPAEFNPAPHDHSKSGLPIYVDKWTVSGRSSKTIDMGQKIDSISVVWDISGSDRPTVAPYVNFSGGNNTFTIYNDNSIFFGAVVTLILRKAYDPDLRP